MTKTFGIGLLAVAATSSMAIAGGGEGEKKSDNALFQSGPVSMKAGSGITFDAGDEFKLNLKNQLQIQWAYVSVDMGQNVNTFDVRRARTKLSGHVFNKNIQFLLKNDWADGPGPAISLKDAWVLWNFVNNEDGVIGARFGQGKSYFGLEATGTSAALDFIERNQSTQSFTDVRSRGVWVHGSHSENQFRWMAGAQNSEVAGDAAGILENGEESFNVDNEVNYVANLSFDPNGDFMGGKTNESFKQSDPDHTQELKGTIGAGVFIGNSRDVTNSFDVETVSWNFHTAWKTKGWFGLGEVFWRSDDPDVAGGVEEDSVGWAVGGSYTLPKSGDSELQWGFAVRVAMLNTDPSTGTTTAFMTGTPLGTSAGDVLELTAGVNAFYRGHNAKTQVNYVFQSIEPDAAVGDLDNHIIALQFTLVF